MKLHRVCLAIVFLAVSLPAQAQSDDAPITDEDVELTVVCGRWDDEAGTWQIYDPGPDGSCEIIGSRRQGRSASNSAVPVDVILGEDLLSYGETSLDQLLASAVPSFNVSQGADANLFFRHSTLRGLAPDAALVLMNGKRRHRGAVIGILGYGISGGAQGVDLAAIPAIAVERVEVLRDGASAQYGSDAIAGAMNVVLRDASRGSTVDLKWGSYYEGDGDSLSVAGNAGLPLGGRGFANVSFEWKDAEPTVRSVQTQGAQQLIDAGNTHVRQPVAQVWGLPRLSDDVKLFGNFGFELGVDALAYAFGNWSERQMEGGFYYRHPHTRQGVFRGPVEDGTPTVKVADLTADGSGNCTPVRVVDNRADADALAAIRSDPNCYSLIERFPGGFTPQFGAFIEDASFVAGIRDKTEAGWSWDLSIATGSSQARFYIHDTVNPQLLALGNAIPTRYKPGAYTETDRVANLDFSKPFAVSAFEGPLNVAFGLEYRDETFKIESGERSSYYVDPNVDHGWPRKASALARTAIRDSRQGLRARTPCAPTAPTWIWRRRSRSAPWWARRFATRTIATSATRWTANWRRACSSPSALRCAALPAPDSACQLPGKPICATSPRRSAPLMGCRASSTASFCRRRIP